MAQAKVIPLPPPAGATLGSGPGPDLGAGLGAAALFERGLRLSAPGCGERRDPVTALALFDVAARLGSLEARIYRHELADELGFEEVAAAQALARDWLARR